jgi:hypothetical protein
VAPHKLPVRVLNPAAKSSFARQQTEDFSNQLGEWESRSDFFGEYIKQKDSKTLRIGFQNIGGYPKEHNKLKEELYG